MVHCVSETQAHHVVAAIAERMEVTGDDLLVVWSALAGWATAAIAHRDGELPVAQFAAAPARVDRDAAGRICAPRRGCPCYVQKLSLTSILSTGLSLHSCSCWLPIPGRGRATVGGHGGVRPRVRCLPAMQSRA